MPLPRLSMLNIVGINTPLLREHILCTSRIIDIWAGEMEGDIQLDRIESTARTISPPHEGKSTAPAVEPAENKSPEPGCPTSARRRFRTIAAVLALFVRSSVQPL